MPPHLGRPLLHKNVKRWRAFRRLVLLDIFANDHRTSDHPRETPMRYVIPLLLGLVASLPASGCAADRPWIELKGERFDVEIADDFKERQRGLMHRDRLASGTGMLFVHAEPERQAYWMKNTRIPLDILYFDAARKLVSVSNAPPCSLGDRCPPHPSAGAALYV